jgi:hypothetical protein
MEFRRSNLGCAKFNRLHLEHHETEMCSPSHCFGPAVRIELGGNADVVGQRIAPPVNPSFSVPCGTTRVPYTNDLACARVASGNKSKD